LEFSREIDPDPRTDRCWDACHVRLCVRYAVVVAFLGSGHAAAFFPFLLRCLLRSKDLMLLPNSSAMVRNPELSHAN
jgi:hypothetical protein